MNTHTISYQLQEDHDLNVYYHNNTFWLTLSNMSKLFNCSTQKVFKALKEVLKKDNLDTLDVNQHLEITTNSGAKSIGNFYNLDVIMAIGYRLNPKETTEFRHWSMFVIKNFIFQQAKMEYSVVGSMKRKFTQLLSA
jgi:hypothetical protein